MVCATSSKTRRYSSNVSPPPIQVLLGSFQMIQYQSRTVSGPHSSRQFQTTSAHWLANQRIARGSRNGRAHLANVTIGVAPTLRTACRYVRNIGQSPTGSGVPLSKTNGRMTCGLSARMAA